MVTSVTDPLPCFVCGKTPKVDSFLLMDLRNHGWTCLCPSKCHETQAYYDRESAVREWNAWVEGEGLMDDDDWEASE